jgi:hypothetical protein
MSQFYFLKMVASISAELLVMLYQYTRRHDPKHVTPQTLFKFACVLGSLLHSAENKGHVIPQREILGDKIGYEEEDAILQEGPMFHFLLFGVISGFSLQ